jgi:hypothetical protein
LTSPSTASASPADARGHAASARLRRRSEAQGRQPTERGDHRSCLVSSLSGAAHAFGLTSLNWRMAGQFTDRFANGDGDCVMGTPLDLMASIIHATLGNETARRHLIASLYSAGAIDRLLLLYVPNLGSRLVESRLGSLLVYQGAQRETRQRLRVRAASRESTCVSRRMDSALRAEMVRRDRRQLHRLVEIRSAPHVRSDTRQQLRREGDDCSKNGSDGDLVGGSTGRRCSDGRHPAVARGHAIFTSSRWHARSTRTP